jgi:flagellar hook-associated protein 2
MANDMIRMSGMNSGLDTESIINALTANTKLKATKQERNVLKYEATQEAYRDVISKMQNVKNKYFDILNKDSYIAGNSMWNKYASKVYNSTGAEAVMSGITVQTTINSNPGEYKVNVNKTAKQAQLKGNSLGGNAKIDASKLEEGKEYGITVTVGDVEKNITFKGGADAAASIKNINDALEKAFGESNDSVGDSGNEGMVYVKAEGGSDLSFVSRAGKGITISGTGEMKSENSLDLSNVKSGTNTLSFQVGDKTLNVSFQTISHDFFDSAVQNGIIDTENGTVVKITDTDEEGNNIRFTRATELAKQNLGEGATEEQIDEEAAKIRAGWSEAVQLYQSVTDDLKESVRYDSFKNWKAAAESDGTWETKLNDLYSEAEKANKESRMTKWLEADETVKAGYKVYKDEFAIDNLSQTSKDAYEAYKTEQQEKGEDVASIYDWAQTDETAKKALEDAGSVKSIYEYAKTADGDVKAKFDELNNKYEGTTETEEELSEQYETYKSGLGEDETPKSYEDWKADHIEDKSWHLSKSTFESSESSLFTQYKNSVYDEDHASYDLTAENVVDHFTKSALKNSIGNLESDGVKFDVNYDNATNKVSISAYTETTTTAEDGTETVVRNPVKLSMTVGKDSANNAEAMASTGSDASTAISQITNTTKLSDIGAEADENGNYSFSINGVDFSFSGDTTVTDMMKKVNASTAGVKMTYSSLDNAFSITASKYGVDSAVDVDDKGGSSLLSAIGLKSGTLTKGENLEVEINGKTYQSNGNSIEADGSTFTFSGNVKVGEDFTINVEKDTSAIKDLIKDFVNDYNQLIEDVYKYLDEKPEKDYYFLTDSDKEDLDLTEKQEEKWEEKAKKGLLYHDNVTSTVMTNLRSALMGSVEGLDGNMFSLSSMGLKTSSDYSQHGKFAKIDETALDAAIESHLDDIEKLFTDSENGIMKKFSAALDAGVKSTGDNKGSLIRKAGLASGTSATDNELYNAIKRTKTKITSLNLRYENEQNRLWKRYSSMESLLGTMNSQQSQFMSYFQ